MFVYISNFYILLLYVSQLRWNSLAFVFRKYTFYSYFDLCSSILKMQEKKTYINGFLQNWIKKVLYFIVKQIFKPSKVHAYFSQFIMACLNVMVRGASNELINFVLLFFEIKRSFHKRFSFLSLDLHIPWYKYTLFPNKKFQGIQQNDSISNDLTISMTTNYTISKSINNHNKRNANHSFLLYLPRGKLALFNKHTTRNTSNKFTEQEIVNKICNCNIPSSTLWGTLLSRSIY